MKLIFDEILYAKKLLRHGFVNFMSWEDLSILAKYLKSLGKNKPQIRSDLVEFCQKHNRDFNEVVDAKRIDDAVKSCDKKFIKQSFETGITQKELDTIRSLDNIKWEKLLFVLIILAKVETHNKIYSKKIRKRKNNNDNFYVNVEQYTPILDMAQININKDERTAILHEMKNRGLLESTLYSTLMIKCIEKDNKDYAIKFLMGENFVKNYVDFVGHKNLIVCCQICGKTFERKGNRQVMCEECGKEKQKENTRKRMNKLRNKNVTP